MNLKEGMRRLALLLGVLGQPSDASRHMWFYAMH
jgi:hypothetical protein